MDSPTDLTAIFSPDFATARRRFRDACARHGVEPAAHALALEGPSGEPLATDSAWFGPAAARRVLVLVSATHGVEGFCGSGSQLDWLATGGPASLPTGTAALIVHAINPYGFAWLRRVTEEGVDLNRNWVDFDRPTPENPGYNELAEAFLPRELAGPGRDAAEKKIADWRKVHGEAAYDRAWTSGQYRHPSGFFYGGREPCHARHTLERIIDDHGLAEREAIAVIDYHTGLGRFGYGEPISGHRPGTLGQKRARAWYGESLTEPMLGTSSSRPIAGLSQYGWDRKVDDRHVFIALEFGTYDRASERRALLEDHWLHAYGRVEWGATETDRIKARLRKHYYPDTDDWREMIVFRSRQVIRQALAGLTAL